jgi:type IV pilus assembly protein PilO
MSKEQQKMLIAAVIVIASLYCYFAFLYAPALKKINDLKGVLGQKQNELEEAKKKAGSVEMLKAEYKELEKQLNFTLKRLPKEVDQAILIREISRAASDKNVFVNTLEFPAISTKGNITEIPIKMTLTSDYHNFGDFLTKLGYSVVLINCAECVFATSGNSIRGSVNVTATFKSFVSQKEKEGGSMVIDSKDAIEQAIIPSFRYSKFITKDPFRSLTSSEIKATVGEVNIATLKLTALIVMGKSSMAVFETSSKVCYYLNGNNFYNRDRKLVDNIQGKIVKGKVTLNQIDSVNGTVKEATYELQD